MDTHYVDVEIYSHLLKYFVYLRHTCKASWLFSLSLLSGHLFFLFKFTAKIASLELLRSSLSSLPVKMGNESF